MSASTEGSRRPHRVVVGVDGGGTRTRAVLTDLEGTELARAGGPPSLADPARPELAAEAIHATVSDVLLQAGIEPPVEAVWAGVAGVGREATRSAVEAALARGGLARRVRVGTDVLGAFQDAFGAGPGILVIAGTGSIAWGRGEDGREARVGGWGSLLGDEGSGYAVGLEALRRVARDVDGRGPGTNLRGRILVRLELSDPDDLVPWSTRAAKSEIAALVPVVGDAAAEGDAVAGEILVKAVEELEGHVLTLLENLGPWSHPPALALAGGLLQPGGPLRRGMERVARLHRLPVLERPLDGARGAAALARALAAKEATGRPS